MARHAASQRTTVRNSVIIGTICLFLTAALLLFFVPGKAPHSSDEHQERVESAVRQQFTGKDGLVSNLAYITDPHAMERLGCPQEHGLSCFYRFKDVGHEIKQPEEGLVTLNDCDAVFRALPADHADKPWCIREGKEPAWLRSEIPKSHWHHERSIALVTGRLDGPNPTHQVNIHFHAIWKWMKQLGIKPGQLRMYVDFHLPEWAPGRFGTGLASALGSIKWLPLMPPGAYIFDQVQFSIPRGRAFVFSIFKHQLDRQIDLDYLELAETVKQVHQPVSAKVYNANQDFWPEEIKRDPRVVIAKRKPTDSRLLANAEDLAAVLHKNFKMDAAVVCFGDLTFPEQVKVAAQADVLVGITGSDLINLMFMPRYGSVVEIFPALLSGESYNPECYTPELYNMARMLGKNHLSYVSAGNVTVARDESGNQIGGKLLHSARLVTVSIPDVVAIIRVAAQQALGGSVFGQTSCSKQGVSISCTSEDIDFFTKDAT